MWSASERMPCPLIQTLAAGLISQEGRGVLKGRSRSIERVLRRVNGMAGLHEIGRVLIKEDHMAALLHVDTTLAIRTNLVTDHYRHHCIEFADIVCRICCSYCVLIICQI